MNTGTLILIGGAVVGGAYLLRKEKQYEKIYTVPKGIDWKIKGLKVEKFNYLLEVVNPNPVQLSIDSVYGTFKYGNTLVGRIEIFKKTMFPQGSTIMEIPIKVSAGGIGTVIAGIIEGKGVTIDSNITVSAMGFDKVYQDSWKLI